MSVNVEKIMQEIRNEIKEKGYTYDILSFKDISIPSHAGGENASIESTEKKLVFMGNVSTVASCRPLAGKKPVILIKRIIRKLTKFYVEPIVESQNTFNNAAVQSVSSIFELIKQQSQDKNSSIHIYELSERLSTLELQLRTAHTEIQALNDRISVLEYENRNLKNKMAER